MKPLDAMNANDAPAGVCTCGGQCYCYCVCFCQCPDSTVEDHLYSLKAIERTDWLDLIRWDMSTM